MRKQKSILIILSFVLFSLPTINSSIPRLDSLYNFIEKAKHDTTLHNIYIEIGKEFKHRNPDSALIYYHKSLELAESKELNKQEALSLVQIGNIYRNKADYDIALNYYSKALKTYKDVNYKAGIATCYNNMGVVYSYMADFNMAVEFFLKSLNIRKEIGDKQGMSRNYNNIGIIYDYLGVYDKSIEYHIKSLNIKNELDDKRGMFASYNNIGSIYHYQSTYDRALEYFYSALEIALELDNKMLMSRAYNNIGIAWRNHDNYDKALDYLSKSLEIKKELGDRQGMSDSYMNIGVAYRKLGDSLLSEGETAPAIQHYNMAIETIQKSMTIAQENEDKRTLVNAYFNFAGTLLSLAGVSTENERETSIQKALEYGLNAYTLAVEIGALHLQNTAAGKLMSVYKKMNNPIDAFKYAEIFIDTRETLFSEEKTKSLAEMQTKYETEKKQQEIEKQRLIIEKKELDNIRQRTQRNFFIAGSSLMTLLVLIVFAGYQQKKRSNTLITEKNILLEQANEEINAQKDEILTQHDMVISQKHHIENQKQQITDSINYAKFIQTAVLPSNEYTKNILGDHFILYKPKDIVSGDFYWLTQMKGLTIFSVADCTGHGVPGAFMSMLGLSFLKEIVSKKEITKPDEILNNLREYIIEALQQKGRYGDQNEGMDMALCALNKSNNQLSFAGARNPLLIVTKNNKLKIVDPDKQPIAIHKKMKPFTSQQIQLEKGDIIYLATDGYQDQFGDKEHKRFTRKDFRNLLVKNAGKNMEEQKDILNSTFEVWKGLNEQIDDVTVMGIRI